MFIFAPGTHIPERVVDVAEIDRASLAEPAAVCLNELNLGFWFKFRRSAEALAFATQVNKAILESRPRSVPHLFPDYYVEILTSADITPTFENVARLVGRTVAMFGGQAGAFCAQTGNRATFDVFLRTFAPSAVLEDQSNVVDEMVDWLWARNPGFHFGIKRQLMRWREGLRASEGTFLDGGNVLPWMWDTGAEGAVKMWTLVFNDTKPSSPAPC
ncbi:hypothetical protein [Rhizocola hellebori]|nr:hypothetical protein [Rhizocola hellebori]